MATDFFPTDLIADEPGVELSADRRLKLDVLKTFIKSEKLAALVLALAEEDPGKDFMLDSLNEANNKYLASRYNHESDLVWAMKELRQTLAVWSRDNEILGAAEAKDMVYRILATLSEKIEEFE